VPEEEALVRIGADAGAPEEEAPVRTGAGTTDDGICD
jgi:hypothetical protein